MRNNQPYQGIIKRFYDRLPVHASTPIVSLNEGNTPLLPLKNLAQQLGNNITVFAKIEGQNPTGSFKDRGMTLAISKALEAGSRAVICASTGNTSASASAYAARAGIKAIVIIPEGNIALGKLAQAMMHGALVLQISDNFDQALRIVREIGDTHALSIVNSINPYRLEGQKTIAFEITESLGDAPDYHYLPVGNAGNISAHWMGYCEDFRAQRCSKRPVMVGFQAQGAAPFLRGGPVADPQTSATAIRIGAPASWDKAMQAKDESNGWFGERSDEDILGAQRLLACLEGIFCEPASAVSVAGLLHDVKEGRIAAGSTVVCTLTGHGLKDPDIAITQTKQAVKSVPAITQALRDVIMPWL